MLIAATCRLDLEEEPLGLRLEKEEWKENGAESSKLQFPILKPVPVKTSNGLHTSVSIVLNYVSEKCPSFEVSSELQDGQNGDGSEDWEFCNGSVGRSPPPYLETPYCKI